MVNGIGPGNSGIGCVTRAVSVYGDELFGTDAFVLTQQLRDDMATRLGVTQKSRITPKLRRDAEHLKHSAIHVRHFAPGMFERLMRELGPHFTDSPFRRSKHPQIIDEKIMTASPTYMLLRQAVLARFPTLQVGFSIVNLYRDGSDVKELHRDNFQAKGYRHSGFGAPEAASTAGGAATSATQGAPEEMEHEPHNVTVGISLGGARSLVFHHLESEAEFSFLQEDGDLFAFTTPVNSAFQHGILKERTASMLGGGPRISVVFWGRVQQEQLL